MQIFVPDNNNRIPEKTIGNFDITRSLAINIQIIFNEKIDNFPTLVTVVVVIILDKNLDNGQNLNGFRLLSLGGSLFLVMYGIAQCSDCIPIPQVIKRNGIFANNANDFNNLFSHFISFR